MKRILLLALILLAACASPSLQTPASYFNATPASVGLTMDAASEQIQQAMLHSATYWATIQMDGTVTWYAPDGNISQVYQEQDWLDPLNSRYKVELLGTLGSIDKTLKFSDGTQIYNVNRNSGLVETLQYPDFARVGQYVPPLEADVTYPNPIWGQIGTPLSEMVFSSNFAQNKGTFKPIGIETVAGREALTVEWLYTGNSSPAFKAWLDTQTAVILKMQEFGKDGSGALQGERVVDHLVYNQPLDSALFVMPADIPQVTRPTQVGATPVVTATGPMSASEAGELYFFLQPRKSGESIQLVHVSGVCVFDGMHCPAVEQIQAPFAFNFTINPLAWSPDGKFAAFAYSDNPAGTPTKLWLFDPSTHIWTALTEFPYIDPPFWSPDGTWIAFRTQDGRGGEAVYVVHRDGSDLKNLDAGLPAQGMPYIMDGWYTENIIMRSALPGRDEAIYLVRASDGTARPMFDQPLTKAQFVAAPDASLLAYDDYDATSQVHVLKVMESDGANPVTLANFTSGSLLYPLVWSPDSRFVAFNYYGDLTVDEPKAEVYVVGRDGGNLSKVYQGVTVGRLLFSPNGRYLLIEETTSPTGGHLFVVDLATLKQSILQAPGLSTDYDWYAPSWRP